MASKAPSRPVTLIYGNQAYSVEQAATALVDRILGDGPRDFAFHRFDAQEMLRSGSAEAVGETLDAFQIACETTPFLAEQYVVRLHRLEAVRVADRAVQNLQRALADLRVFAVRWKDEPAWALEADLLPGDPRGELAPVSRWVHDVEARTGAPPLLHLDADPSLRFALAQGGERRLVSLKTFLGDKLKGRFAFADEAGPTGQAGAAPASASARLHQLLERLIERTPPGLHLVLTARASRESDLSRPLLAKLKQHGTVEKFVTYDDYNPADWVQRESRERGMPLSRPVAELLIHLVGNDLGRLAGELEKLALLHAGGAAPDEEAVLRAVHGGQSASLFLITDKLGARDLPGALGVLEHFLADSPGEHPVLIGILARFFRQLLHVHTLEQTGVSEGDWPSRLKLHPFIARKVAAQARRFTAAELEAILRALAGMDLAVKRHAPLTGPLFREFVHAVCQEGFRDPGGPLGGRLADFA